MQLCMEQVGWGGRGNRVVGVGWAWEWDGRGGVSVGMGWWGWGGRGNGVVGVGWAWEWGGGGGVGVVPITSVTLFFPCAGGRERLAEILDMSSAAVKDVMGGFLCMCCVVGWSVHLVCTLCQPSSLQQSSVELRSSFRVP